MLGLIVAHQDTVNAWHPLSDERVSFQYQPSEFAEFLSRAPDSLLVGCHIATKVKAVADYWGERRPLFQIAGAPIRHPEGGRSWESILPPGLLDELRPDHDKPQDMFSGGIFLKYIGWKKKAHAAYSPRHYPIDPYLFARDNASDRFRRMSVEDFQLWAQEFYDFLERYNLSPAPSFYKLAAQILRSRFVEGHSSTLNERLRTTLPGNYYLYEADPRHVYSEVLEIDQSNAHHFSASRLAFPHKSSVSQIEQVPWPSYLDRYMPYVSGTPYREITHHGILQLQGEVPYQPSREIYLPPPWNEAGTHTGYVFTNELQDLIEVGKLRPIIILRGWIGDEVDPNPSDYAKWAMEQIRAASPMQKRWLKPTLLAVYGMLGARPFRQISVWKTSPSESGTRARFHVGKDQWMDLTYKYGEEAVPSRFANVIHRGMIEAETRLASLRMARRLRDQGYEVLAIYADGIYVKGSARKGTQLPLLPYPWRVNPITNAHFPHKGQVICDQYEKLPGVVGYLRKPYVAQIRGLESDRA